MHPAPHPNLRCLRIAVLQLCSKVLRTSTEPSPLTSARHSLLRTTDNAANLGSMPGFGGGTGVAVGGDGDGSVDPSTQIFRASFVGVDTGPMISQVPKYDIALADNVSQSIAGHKCRLPAAPTHLLLPFQAPK